MQKFSVNIQNFTIIGLFGLLGFCRAKYKLPKRQEPPAKARWREVITTIMFYNRWFLSVLRKCSSLLRTKVSGVHREHFLTRKSLGLGQLLFSETPISVIAHQLCPRVPILLKKEVNINEKNIA